MAAAAAAVVATATATAGKGAVLRFGGRAPRLVARARWLLVSHHAALPRRLIPLTFALACCATASTTPEAPRSDVASLYAPHFRDGAFFNPWEEMDFSLGKLLRFVFTPNPYDKSREPRVPVVANDGAELAGEQTPPRLTWVGHATVVIHDGEDVVLTDPVFAKRAFLFKRHTPPGVPIESIPADAMAVISHNHNDHLDAHTVETLADTVTWFVPKGLAGWFRKRGRERVIELDWWETAEHGRWRMTCLPSQHWSRRIEMSTNRSLWCAWLMRSGEHSYFFAGDTGYFHGFREYGRRFPDIDVALLPIGAYEPRSFMRYHHMRPSEAWQAFSDLGARWMLPVHWGTFDLAWEPLDRPIADLAAAIEDAGGDDSSLVRLPIGGSFEVPESHPRERDSL